MSSPCQVTTRHNGVCMELRLYMTAEDKLTVYEMRNGSASFGLSVFGAIGWESTGYGPRIWLSYNGQKQYSYYFELNNNNLYGYPWSGVEGEICTAYNTGDGWPNLMICTGGTTWWSLLVGRYIY